MVQLETERERMQAVQQQNDLLRARLRESATREDQSTNASARALEQLRAECAGLRGQVTSQDTKIKAILEEAAELSRQNVDQVRWGWA